MNGNKFVVDTNTIIFHLAGNVDVESLLDTFIAAASFFSDIPLITFDNGFDKIKDLKIVKIIE